MTFEALRKTHLRKTPDTKRRHFLLNEFRQVFWVFISWKVCGPILASQENRIKITHCIFTRAVHDGLYLIYFSYKVLLEWREVLQWSIHPVEQEP